ncbi:16S rRNA (guanine(527)-N(7))-methyltransferase RsmG [Thioclava sp. SK-1]|uniref:16S rRNA (guanine(527)-N(7))-methyltransferase RsmG n=1 Tax=Thioclava sp. SK-1 TaxID=1889770 RepID=UPI0008240733|nr:16S rRNA (guanine(527)-N(7))-methyltransferase RsmG [Thioclava sp. SK-1]OCX65334.1 16S rRNA (guanine(527)-N(7))-methyltransferase RsmG [Thioclava sp. SK-1]
MQEQLSEILGSNVSRETLERFAHYQSLIIKWNPAINLVSKSTIPDLWSRHFLDSAQMFAETNLRSGIWLDIGSGGGFPGLVCAILAAEFSPEFRMHLVESDQRKSIFLSTVARELSLNVEVHATRIEALEPARANVLSARALASLDLLLEFAERHLLEDGTALFSKGETWKNEVVAAKDKWRFECDPIQSYTNEAAAILRISGVSRV